MATIREQAHKLLNLYLKRQIGALHLPDAEEIGRQRNNFLEQFGPEQLRDMSGPKLMEVMPHNASNPQSMDYWLEFKNDELHHKDLFGSIAGGSANKFGTWQDKKTGEWKSQMGHGGVGRVAVLTEDEVINILRSRRDEAVAAVDALSLFKGYSVSDLDPEAVQESLEKAAPRWWNWVWLHKYLHLTVPQLITWSHSEPHGKGQLNRLGVVPIGTSPYGLDVLLMKFWSSLPAIQDVPMELWSLLGRGLEPRDHWRRVLSQGESWTDMVEHGYIGLGPNIIGDLSEVSTLTKQREAKQAVLAAFADTGTEPTKRATASLVILASRAKEGDIVTLMPTHENVIAVGEVAGSYMYAQGMELPHRIPVRWLHTDGFSASEPPIRNRGFYPTKPTHPLMSEVEASLIANGRFPWPEFAKVVDVKLDEGPLLKTPKEPTSASVPPMAPELAPEDPITRRVIEMLHRKAQVILFGPPGTGKTYYAERVALELVARNNFGKTSTQLSDHDKAAIKGQDGSPHISMCTFHPMYSYEDFIEGYRPDGEGFSRKDGVFKRMVKAAKDKPTTTFVLIIDEINRGNIPKIFGELITLMEVSKRGKAQSILPLSGEAFTVPKNLYLIGTMNTADRSILLLDTALRRRFAFIELMPQPELLKGGQIGDISLPVWLRALNRRIVENLGLDGRNLQVGHAYFMPEGKAPATLRRIADIVRDDIWPLVQEYCYEDASKLSAILAADKGGIYDRITSDLRHGLFEPGRHDDLVLALSAIVTPEDIKADAEIEVEEEIEEDISEPEDEEIED